MKNKIRNTFISYLQEYISKKYSKSSKAYGNSLIRKSIGGRNYFLTRKDREEIKRKKRENKKGVKRLVRNRKNKDELYRVTHLTNEGDWEDAQAIRERWIAFWENEMTEAQKIQFMHWFKKKIAIQKVNGKKQWTAFQGLAHLYKRMETLSNIYFNKGTLNTSQWMFVREMSEFFGDILTSRAITPTTIEEVKDEKEGWKYPNKPSSWIIKFRYEGERHANSKGILRVLMKRGKMAYPFYNFPYELYVMLTYLTTSLGEYWWEKWLWRYSSNPTKYSKFAYRKNQEKLDKFIRSR